MIDYVFDYVLFGAWSPYVTDLLDYTLCILSICFSYVVCVCVPSFHVDSVGTGGAWGHLIPLVMLFSSRTELVI